MTSLPASGSEGQARAADSQGIDNARAQGDDTGMAQYRIITKHVKYWRGAIHRWSNSYQFQGTAAAPSVADLTTLQAAEADLLYSPSTGIWGGCYEVVAYAAGGGPPLAVLSRFDPDTPASWTAYSGAGWVSHTVNPETVAEAALLVEWPAGLSSSGKPVNFRKWYHAIPLSGAATGGAADIPSATVTTLTAKAVVLTNCLAASHLLLSTGARYAGTPVVSPFYANHQMPRGRRRRALVTSSGRYTGPTISFPAGATIPD